VTSSDSPEPSPTSAGETRRLAVPEGLEGERVDVGLARLLGFSRTQAADLAASGKVLVDGAQVGKSDRLVAGTWIDIQLPEVLTAGAPVAPTVGSGMRVVFSDESIVVVDKPAGVAAHPSPGWSGPTVLSELAGAGFRVSTSGASERQGIVHRLDVGTSGLMVVAASEQAYTRLKAAFKTRTVDKTYHALVQGHPDPSKGTIDAPIGRHPRHDWRWAVTASGKASITHYQTLQAFSGTSLLSIDLETGRTHQIRVHMSAIKHPCVGDLTYGADPTVAERLGLARQWLHATRLAFQHPLTGESLTFSADYPADLRQALTVVTD